MIYLEYFIFNAFQERCTLVWDDDRNCAVIDPGFIKEQEKEVLYGFIKSNNLIPKAILLTHAHFDHIYGLAAFARDFNVPAYMHEKDACMFENNLILCSDFYLPVPESYEGDIVYVTEGDVVTVGGLEFKVLETPGHTPGGVCYLESKEGVLFSGDTLFAGSIGRTDRPWGDYDRLMESIFSRLMTLDGEITVIPGHGPITSIAEERTTNPFLFPFNEPYEE